MQRTHARAVGLLLVVLTLATVTGCRGDDPDPALRATVTRWIDAWTRASGHDRDEVAAAQARAELGGELLTRTEAAAR
ncbi:MAG: hypothetical protein O3B31_08095, partial [Chloroflexi bacterium]|nr:hypothetical protein [Chloroflexota bacterium]